MNPTRPATLHYIHDPLCGWCYGAAPLLKVAREVLPVAAHGGGMMAGANRQPVTPRLREFVMPHDRRIAQLSGQPFGEGYTEGLLRDSGAVFDSEPPITAMLAAEQVAGRGLDLLSRMQQAHYVEGRRIAEPDVLAALAAEIGIDREAFEAAFAQLAGAPTQAHITESRALLGRVGGSGFPTFALELRGRWDTLDIGPYLGNAEGWRARLQQEIGAVS